MSKSVQGKRCGVAVGHRILAAAALAAVAAITAPTKATDGVWTATGGGSWPTAGNWASGVVADGSGAVADFSTLDLSADATVTVDGARTVGKLIFGDTNPSNNWILSTGTAGPLTLAGTGSGVTVNNGTATVNAVLAGTDGLIKDGAGQLTLTAVNTYTGETVVNGGILALNKGGATGAIRGTLTINGGGVVKLGASNATGYDATNRVKTLNINEGGLLDDVANGDNLWGITINLTGGTMQSNGGVANATAAQLFSLGGGSVVNTLASGTTSVIAGRVNMREGNANNQLVFNVADGAADVDLQVSAALTQNAAGRVLVKNGAGTMVIDNTLATYSGGTIVNAGTLRLTAGGTAGAVKGTLTVNAGATVESTVKDSFGYSGAGTSVTVLNINGGTVSHTGVGNNLTLWNEVITMTGGLLQSTDPTSMLDFGNGSTFNTLASPTAATLAGRFNMRQASNVFTVARGTAATDLLVTANMFGNAGAGITKNGAGIMELTGNNTYTGDTVVNAGTLKLSGTGTLGSGTVSVNAGGTLMLAGTPTVSSAVINVADGGTLDTSGVSGGFATTAQQMLTIGHNGTTAANDVVGSLTVGGVLNVGGLGSVKTATVSQDLTLSGATLKYDLANVTTAGGGVNDLITSKNLNLQGSNMFVLNPVNGSLASGTYTLMTYTGALSGDTSNLAVAGIGSGVTRQSFGFSTSTPGSVLLTISGNAANLIWKGDGASNVWDVNQTPNWKNGAAIDKFFELDHVVFDDTGSNTPDVQLASPVSPGALLVNNSQIDYTFSGGGSISGLTGLVKQGTKTLTLSTFNDFTGPVTVNNGVLSVNSIANQGQASALGAGSTIALGDTTTNGTLQYTGGGLASTDRPITLNAGGGTIEQTDAGGILTLAGVISGPGGLTTKGGGLFNLSGANTYTGPTLVGTGTVVRPGTDTSLGSGTAMVTVQPGGTLDVNGRNLSTHPITISGTGYQDQGALINNGPDQTNALNKVILAGDATVTSTGRFDIRAGANPTLDLQGHKLTKIGAKQFSLVNTAVTAGDIDVNEGTMSVEANTTFTGAGTITVNPGAILGVYGNTAGAFTRNVTLAGGTLNNLGSAATVDARITLAQDTFSTISTPTTTAGTVLNGGLTGPGSVLIESAVTLNTKPGDHIGGTLTNNASTISPGGSNVGTFTTDGGLTLNGGSLRFDLSSNPASGNDQLVIGSNGSLILSGTTTIVPSLLNGMLGNGTYTLISGPTLAAGDASNLALSFGATRQTLALDTSTTPGSVLLKVSGNTASLVWSGNVSNAWDVNTTQNWANGANPDVFFNLDTVKFDNSSTNGAVVLNTAIAPQSVTFDNSTTNYTFTGTGTIGGSGSVVKNGTGTVTYGQKQTYTGGTTVNAGTLALTVGGSQGALNGVLTVNTGATVQSGIKDSFGYGGGTNQVTVLNINGGTVTHASNDNLTLWAEQINMTGGLLQATGGTSSQLDFGNGSVLNVLPSANVATIGGNKFNMRQDVNLITVADGAAPVDLLVSAPITSDTATRGLTKAGPGTMVISSTSTYGGPTSVTGGTLNVSGSIAGSSGVTVNGASAAYEAASTQKLKALTVTSGVARVVNGAAKQVLTIGDGTSATSTLTLTGGTLDIDANGVAVDYATSTPAGEAAVTASVRNQIIAGLGAGKDWKGTTGITSSDAAASPSNRAIGYALATEVLPFTAGNTDTFLGATVDKTSVVARYTLAGDATLDGTVDFNDLVKLAQNYNTTVSATTESWWNKGDFTYDGMTDFNDLVKLAQNYNTALPTEPIPGASAAFEADLAKAFASVPEPGTLSILGVGGIALMGRRRRRSR